MRDLETAPEAPGARAETTAPLLSIVIPVFNLAGYIESCLDSITQQKFGDVEIIAVDGQSTDNSRQLLEQKRLVEPRLRVLDAERGPGPARDRGAAGARGEYLWFVDGDDELAPDALTAVAERLRSDRPDVLLVNHRVLEPAGLTDGQDERLLAAEDGRPGALTERPWLIDVSMVSWNKIARREFYQASGAEFSRRWPHEDVQVSCRLLLRAARISVLHQVCYHFRKERPGSATKAGDSRRHFAVFDAWAPILTDAREKALAGDPGTPVSVYNWLFQRAVWHCSTILDPRPAASEPYVAAGDRKEFFGRIADLYGTYKLRGYRRPSGFRGIRFWLIAGRHYRLHVLLRPLNTGRIRATAAARAVAGREASPRRGRGFRRA
jgi:CDP-glycerol glycerophosphotransferase